LRHEFDDYVSTDTFANELTEGQPGEDIYNQIR